MVLTLYLRCDGKKVMIKIFIIIIFETLNISRKDDVEEQKHKTALKQSFDNTTEAANNLIKLSEKFVSKGKKVIKDKQY